MTTAVMSADEQLACLMVSCDRCGATWGEQCPGGQPCGARRLLAIEHGHLGEATGAWVTRGHGPAVWPPAGRRTS